MDQDQQLINASQMGDVDTLYALIQKDSYVLEHIDKLPFANSPLHFAASAGCTEFAMEIMKLMPSFAWKLNQDGFSPIHLALQNEQSQVVLGLLQLDGLLVRIKGRQGITPLHYVARSGNINLLAAFLSVCPKSIEDVTSRNETALHIALRSNMYEAFQFLLHWVCHEEDFYLKKKFLDHRDVEGNTLLHIATSRNQPQFVRLLIDQGVDIKAKNSENMTALAIAQGQELENNEVKDILHDAEDSALPSYFYDYCLSIDEKLRKAAEGGSVVMLHFLLEQDPHLLECLDRITAADSPVHIAARKGNTTFVLEIVSLKPSLARKLNQHGLSPIHLALQEGQTQTVIGLMRIDSELIRLRGKDGITPLHYVAEMGDVVLLSKFLRSCPSSIHDLTVHCQTAVHIAVKKKKLAAFEFLFGWLHRRNMEEILNWKDDEGNTVLHIAVQENEPRAVQLLINNVDIDVRNLDDKTVVNIFDSQGQSQNSKIKQILSSASSFSRLLNSLVRIRDTYLGVSAENENPASDVRDIILVVAVLIATATYQAVLSPPGGFWGDNYDPPGNTTNASVIDGQQKPHRAGTIIMDGWESSYFALLNSAAFCASVSTIIILMMGLPFALLLVGSTVFISFSYFFSLHTIFPALDGITVFLLSLLGAILFSVHVLEFEVHRRQRERRRVGILY